MHPIAHAERMTPVSLGPRAAWQVVAAEGARSSANRCWRAGVIFTRSQAADASASTANIRLNPARLFVKRGITFARRCPSPNRRSNRRVVRIRLRWGSENRSAVRHSCESVVMHFIAAGNCS